MEKERHYIIFWGRRFNSEKQNDEIKKNQVPHTKNNRSNLMNVFSFISANILMVLHLIRGRPLTFLGGWNIRLREVFFFHRANGAGFFFGAAAAGGVFIFRPSEGGFFFSYKTCYNMAREGCFFWSPSEGGFCFFSLHLREFFF